MKLTRSGLIALVFLAGCAVGGASSQLVVPKANAQNVQRWDYMCINEWDRERVEEKSKQAGQEGWELASSTTVPRSVALYWCFKRPM